jgi:hypothetical protein
MPRTVTPAAGDDAASASVRAGGEDGDAQLAQEKDRQAVLAVMQALFDGIANRDKDAMRATMMPDGTAVHSRDGVITVERLGDLPDRMPGGTAQMQERALSTLVRVDHDVAMVWAPYVFLVDGEVHHEGTNVFGFMKQSDGRWLISGFTDNGRSVA